jgi:hypothetical protein
MHSESADPMVSASIVLAREESDLKRLRTLVGAARARLAELEAAYTIEKAKLDALQARLFSRLRQYHQERERLRIILSYRKQFLEALLRKGMEKAEEVQRECHEAEARSAREYEKTAVAMAAKKKLTADEEDELGKLWKTLVKLYHPDRFSHKPQKLGTYSKLTAAINRAKDTGDLDMLREVASDPHGFILRQGWASLDFREEQEIAQLRKLLETLELEILRVTKESDGLHESPEFELYELTAKNAEMFEEIVTTQTALLEKEIANLRNESDRLSKEIAALSSCAIPGGD